MYLVGRFQVDKAGGQNFPQYSSGQLDIGHLQTYMGQRLELSYIVFAKQLELLLNVISATPPPQLCHR